ncbi:hypothetical protein QBC43DRAFT_353739 [Cladorrhinum sp. PSN259]|nr:hypothetical protein QBC43DRAFT_353739 [Cladorrhinum sp. PSN259]
MHPFNLLPLLLTSLLHTAAHAHPNANANVPSAGGPSNVRNHHPPTKNLGGVSVIDTPLVRAAQDLARTHNDEHAYKHVMRSWLFGAILIRNNATLRNSIDLEVHAVSTLLHDLGWVRTPNNTFVSSSNRFEVDGAIASRNFLNSHPDGLKWSPRKVQLVWDAIALHTEPRIAWFKEPDVAAVQKGIGMDFAGPQFGVSQQEYDAVVREFPKEGFRESLNGTMIWLCETKAGSTYDTFIQPWGDKYVQGYEEEKVQTFDTIFNNLP